MKLFRPNREPSENGNQNLVNLKGRYVIVRMDLSKQRGNLKSK